MRSSSSGFPSKCPLEYRLERGGKAVPCNYDCIRNHNATQTIGCRLSDADGACASFDGSAGSGGDRYAHGIGLATLLCEVRPITPVLNFGLRLQAGYTFRLPARQFPTSGANANPAPHDYSGCVAAGRVLDRPRQTTRQCASRFDIRGRRQFLSRSRPIHIDWLLRDDSGRECRREWDINAELPRGNRGVRLAMAPGAVADLSLQPRESASKPDQWAGSKRFTILLDASPLSAAAQPAGFGPGDQVFLLGGFCVARASASISGPAGCVQYGSAQGVHAT